MPNTDILTIARQLYMQVEATGKQPRFLWIPVIGPNAHFARELVEFARSQQMKSKLILPRGVETNRNLGLENMNVFPPAANKMALQLRINIGEDLTVAA